MVNKNKQLQIIIIINSNKHTYTHTAFLFRFGCSGTMVAALKVMMSTVAALLLKTYLTRSMAMFVVTNLGGAPFLKLYYENCSFSCFSS